ncbi:MAG: haloacid dehalogenase superfamily, subfamily IA, variant 3 with third motif having DD or ED [uncultured archaeon A07HN63]|nr:MAG: haloacid dehalogenase superfamily, subfamily IA, variant 3 with third motif having DD or ED [uncultured archaeon A07HN63]
MAETTPAVRAVLFDMDGVIVDSERYWHDAQKERIFPAALAGEYPDLDETTGMYYKEIYDYLDEHYETTVSKAEFVDLFDEAAREMYREQVSLLDGFHDLRDNLVATDIAVAIVTSAPPAWHSIVTERFDIAVDETVSAADIDGDGKPAPDVYEHAAAVLDCEPSDCLVVEDSKTASKRGNAPA